MDRQLYQKQYDFELEQRNVIASSTNTPVVSITVIGGALSSMIVTFPYTREMVTWLFLFFSILSAVFSIIALVYIFRSVIGYSYQKIPTTAALSAHFDKLKEWHKNNGTPSENITVEAKRDFDIYFEDRLSEAADHNGNNNIRRGNFIHDSTIAIAVALALLGLCSPFFIYAKSNSKEKTHKIEVVNPITIKSEVMKMTKSNNSNDSGSNDSQATAQSQQTSTTAQGTQPKPTGPPNITFKGSVDHTVQRIDTNCGESSGSGKKQSNNE